MANFARGLIAGSKIGKQFVDTYNAGVDRANDAAEKGELRRISDGKLESAAPLPVSAGDQVQQEQGMSMTPEALANAGVLDPNGVNDPTRKMSIEPSAVLQGIQTKNLVNQSVPAPKRAATETGGGYTYLGKTYAEKPTQAVMDAEKYSQMATAIEKTDPRVGLQFRMQADQYAQIAKRDAAEAYTKDVHALVNKYEGPPPPEELAQFMEKHPGQDPQAFNKAAVEYYGYSEAELAHTNRLASAAMNDAIIKGPAAVNTYIASHYEDTDNDPTTIAKLVKQADGKYKLMEGGKELLAGAMSLGEFGQHFNETLKGNPYWLPAMFEERARVKRAASTAEKNADANIGIRKATQEQNTLDRARNYELQRDKMDATKAAAEERRNSEAVKQAMKALADYVKVHGQGNPQVMADKKAELFAQFNAYDRVQGSSLGGLRVGDANKAKAGATPKGEAAGLVTAKPAARAPLPPQQDVPQGAAAAKQKKEILSNLDKLRGKPQAIKAYLNGLKIYNNAGLTGKEKAALMREYMVRPADPMPDYSSYSQTKGLQ